MTTLCKAAMIWIGILGVNTFSSEILEQDLTKMVREHLPSVSTYLFSDDQTTAITEQAVAHLKPFIEMLSRDDVFFGQESATGDRAYGQEDIPSEYLSALIGMSIRRAISETIRGMKADDRDHFTVKCIEYARRSDDVTQIDLLRQILMQEELVRPPLPHQAWRRLVEPLFPNHHLVRRFVYDELTQDAFSRFARILYLTRVPEPTEHERTQLASSILQGHYELIELAIKWHLNAELRDGIRKLVEEETEMMEDLPEIYVYMSLLISQDEVPLVNHYFEEDDTIHNVPLFLVYSMNVKALDIAHAYLATFGDEQSVNWLIQRYQETKVAGMLQPASAYRYYQLLYLAGVIQDGPIRLDIPKVPIK